MAAPTLGGTGGVAAGTGQTSTHTLPATINADDIIVIYAVAGGNSGGGMPSAFTWPSGFTNGRTVNIFDQTGTHVGCAGWAWKRATGTEGGTSVGTQRNTSGGTGTVIASNSFTIVGCETSGDPFDVEVVNNPSASTTGDYPSITTLTPDSFIFSAILKAGLNGNFGTPTNWTTILSNQSTAGIDMAMDSDYRQVAATGTYDPTSPTLTIDADTAWAAFQVAFIPPGAGGTPHTVEVDDSVSVSDAIKFARGLSVSDSLSLADAIKFGRGLGIADSVSVADSITTARGIGIIVNDTASVADSLGSSAELFRTVDDSAGLVDVLTRAAEYFRTVDDTVGLADQIQAGLAFARTVDDLVSLADNVLRAANYVRSVNDTLSLADNIDVDHTAGPTDHTRAINDSVVITDAISIAGVEPEIERLMDRMWRFTRRRDARRTFGR